MKSFFAIDPGLAARGGSGWAYFAAPGRLLFCGVLRNEKTWVELGARIRGQSELLDAIRDDIDSEAPVVCEWMQARYGNAKGDVQDLVNLNALSGHLGDYWVTATQWVGGVPAAVAQSRTRVALTPEERDVMAAACANTIKGMHKEIWSAVGIGLSVAGRCHRKCGWPEKEAA